MKKVIVLVFWIFFIMILCPISTNASSFPNEHQEFDYVFGQEVPFEISYEVHEYVGIGNFFLVLFGVFGFLAICFFEKDNLSLIFMILSLVSLLISGMFIYIF